MSSFIDNVGMPGLCLGFFVWGGRCLKVIVDGGCSHRPQFSRGVLGHEKFLNIELSESGSEEF